MNPLFFILPGAAVAGGVALRLRAKAKSGQVTNVPVTSLPVAIQANLATPGAPPLQSFVNSIGQGVAQGVPQLSDPAHILKARNGMVFDPLATGLVNPSPSDILIGDGVTFDIGQAGMQVPTIPGGSSIMLVKSAPSGSTVSGIFIDPRVPEGTAVTIPLNSVTGISPAP